MIRVLVVDDQPLVAGAQGALVDRVPGFRTMSVAHDGAAALAAVTHGNIDLVLLDLSMPGMGGLEVARRLQELVDPPDVIVVTAARDLESVRAAVRNGALLYLVKPFTYPALVAKLEQYRGYREITRSQRADVDQDDIDVTLAALRGSGENTLPKGLTRETLRAVRAALGAAPAGLAAHEVAEAIGASRVTARRYLEHLVNTAGCERHPRYGGAGRPELTYRLPVRPEASQAPDAPEAGVDKG